MKTSVDVHNYLQTQEIPHEMFTLSRPAGDLRMAAATLGIEPSAVAIPRFYLADGRPVLVIVPGDKDIDAKKLEKAIGAGGVEDLGEDRLVSVTGFLPGSPPPVALDDEIQVYIDYYALREDVVYTSGGDNSNILKIRSYDLVRATDAEIVDVVSEESG